MQEHTFWGLTDTGWSALGTVVASIASIVNCGIVVFLAIFTFKYMKSTQAIERISKDQRDASLRQADAAELLSLERKETASYQRAVFAHSITSLSDSLRTYLGDVQSDAKPFHVPDCWFLPEEWDICRRFVSRTAPNLMERMQGLEEELASASSGTQGVIRAPDSQWLSTVQRRRDLANSLESLRQTVERFAMDTLESDQP
jgi:hypothetical protein